MAGREKDRKLRRKQRRQKKLRKLKKKLAETKDLTKRQVLIEKIKRISVSPLKDLPEN